MENKFCRICGNDYFEISQHRQIKEHRRWNKIEKIFKKNEALITLLTKRNINNLKINSTINIIE